jgi:HEPN domain-containing protein
MMTDEEKYEYWLDLVDEDIEVAKTLLNGKNYLQCGFFCHLTVEKLLKAFIALQGDTPPKIHNLIKLAKMADMENELSEEQKRLFEVLNPLNIEARYPSYKARIAEGLTEESCRALVKKVEEFRKWTETKQ